MNQNYSDILGPVFLYWVSQLHDKLSFLAETKGRKALYCTRAGKRIADLMEDYAPLKRPFDSELFGISRISVCKVGAGFAETFHTAHSITAETLRHVTLSDLCRAYLQHEWDETQPQMAALARLRQPYDEANFRSLIAANDPASVFFRERLQADHAALRHWLATHLRTEADLRDNTGYVLVDSGWKGSIQRMLSKCFPTYGFEGLYFGVIDEHPMPGRVGIVFDAARYYRNRPETSFIVHRHIVESILEPNAPSVEDLVGGPADARARAQLAAVQNELPNPEEDALFLGIRRYIAANRHMHPDQILLEHRRALAEIAPKLVTPSREDALALAGKKRSVDFGRKGDIPVLRTDPTCETADRRIAQSLWPQGQSALEYEGQKAKRLQLQMSGLEEAASFFASHETAVRSARADAYAKGKPQSWFGSVAVVTRTKNRPLLFRRAAQSVARQSWKNVQWVVVNDGGESEPVCDIIETSGIDPTRITLIDNASSVGMEAASNLGVRAVDTEFVVIHDDDDQWEPDFLSESVEFLQSSRAAAADFEGVLSRAWRVSEQIDGDNIIIHRSEPYMPWVTEVSLAQMAVGNFFAPISFLYRRWVFDDIGGYDERLPVLGDWRFNLDFLMRANIGFLDRYLSHYHHRDMGDITKTGVYANSVVGARNLHGQYFSVVANRILRDPDTPDALRVVVANAHQQRVMENNFGAIRHRQDQADQKFDRHIGASSHDQKVIEKNLNQYPDPITAGKDNSEDKLSAADLAHIRQSIRRALPYTHSPRRLAARLRWEWRMSQFGKPLYRKTWLPRMIHFVPSPADFDHIGYLRDHPEIWATRFNGKGEWLPYHHYILDGAEKSFVRPTISDT